LSRLKKINQCKQLKKIASGRMFTYLDSFQLLSGDSIEFTARISSNKVMFNISQYTTFSSASYYDGNDFECAFDLYKELVLAFKGIKAAEELSNRYRELEYRAFHLIDEFNGSRIKEQKTLYHMQPLFLGNNDF
jgi:hypothetical protein